MSRPAYRLTTVEVGGWPDTLHEGKLPATYLGDVVSPFAHDATVPVHISPTRRGDAGASALIMFPAPAETSLTKHFKVGRAGLEPATNGL